MRRTVAKVPSAHVRGMEDGMYTKLPDVEGAIGLLHSESVSGGGRGGETVSRGREGCRDHGGVGGGVTGECGGVLHD